MNAQQAGSRGRPASPFARRYVFQLRANDDERSEFVDLCETLGMQPTDLLRRYFLDGMARDRRAINTLANLQAMPNELRTRVLEVLND